MPAIETVYAGYRFRSRLEARWAVFFDQLDIQWLYELEGFEWDHVGRYLPDFYLPTIGSRMSAEARVGVWVEVKPDRYRLTPYDRARYEHLVVETQKSLLVVRGLPAVGGWSDAEDPGNDIEECSPCDHLACWDAPMLLIRCYACRAVRFEFSEGNYMVCHVCGARADDRHGDLLVALDAVKRTRWFGA